MSSKAWARSWPREYRTGSWIILVLAVGAVWLRVGGVSPVFAGQLVLVLLAAIGAYGLNTITGYAGQASLGNAAFMAIGAMTAWYIGSHSVSFVVAVVLGGLVGLLGGAIVGMIALRWRGFYLVLATLALHYIVIFTIQRRQLGGPVENRAGFNFEIPSIGGHAVISDEDWYLVVATVLAVLILCIAGLVNSPTGRAWVALRENEQAASVAGVRVVWVKILAFSIGSGVIALGGALSGYYTGAVGYESYPLSVAVLYVAMIIVGGVGSTAGPFLGACAVTLIPYWVADWSQTGWGQSVVNLRGSGGLPYVQSLSYCLIVIVFLAFEPRGLASMSSRVLAHVRRPGGRFSRSRPERHSDQALEGTHGTH